MVYMLLYLVQLLLVFCTSISRAQVPGSGKCPDVKVQNNFDPTKYYGTWYEITKFFTSFESGQKCNRARYTPTTDGHFQVYNDGLDEKNRYVNATGDAYSPDLAEPAKIKVKFSADSPYADYWVVDTDYVTNTLIYSCINVIDLAHLEFAWILSRTPTLDDNIRRKLYQKLESFNVKTSNFKDDDQSDCPFPPNN